MIFCDMGVNPTAWGYSAYSDVIAKLTARGIPAHEIAVMGDADSDAKKQALFDKVRSGQVRVLIGSTQKMGTGTNVQKRLVALHHLDAPWKPAEVEQREGRILRQGNENPEVAIYRYVTEGSFDAFLWQCLQTKARFINQVMAGDGVGRRAEDVGSQELSYAEVKALASGNPAFLVLAEADAEVQRLSILKRNHADEQFLARRNVKELPDRIKSLTERLAGLTADRATLAGSNRITIGNRSVGEDAVAVLGAQMDSLPEFIMKTQRVPLGKYHGLRFGMVLHPQYRPEVYVEGVITRQDSLGESRGPRAVLNSVERMTRGYEIECRRTQEDLGIAQGQLRDYEAKLGSAFPHADYLHKMEGLRDRLKMALSGSVQESEPSVEELADQIRALREGNAVESVPERIATRKASAEEPVSRRLLRREQEGTGEWQQLVTREAKSETGRG